MVLAGAVQCCHFFGSLFQVSDSAFNSEYDSVFDSAFDYVYDCGTFAGH